MIDSATLKPYLLGAAAGAIAVSVIGFTLGGWKTGSAADKFASQQSRMEVAAALATICIEQSKHDPEFEETLTVLQHADSYKQTSMLMKTGWATMPGAADADRDVAIACMERLSKE